MMNPIVLKQIYFKGVSVRFYSVSGIRYATNVRHIANKTQLSSGYSHPLPINNIISPKNMILRHCSPIPAMTIMDPSVHSLEVSSVRRPLTIILAWMLAKDKHLEKYRQLWFKRGFDVLTVRTSPIDLLLPPIGGRVVASNLVNYLNQINSQYNEIVIHAFSVGGYQFGETLVKLQSSDEYRDICDSIKGVVIDSMVFMEDAAPGLSRAISENPILQPILEASIFGFLKLFENISVKHYKIASDLFFNPFFRCPGLIYYSDNDIVSNVKANEYLARKWREKGLSVQTKCWKKSTHILHYRDHQQEYEQELDTFIKKLKIRNH